MKKITYILVFTFMLLFPLSTLASSRVVFTEKENGIIDTKLHFNDGFVGGLDIIISVSENVNVKDVTFNKEFAKFTTNYEYDQKTHLLTIKITTGGINQTHNLLNNKKELDLGSIHFTTDSKESVRYLLVINKITVINNNWDSVIYEKNAIEVDGKNTFEFVVNKKEEVTDDKKEETVTPETPSQNPTTDSQTSNQENNDKVEDNKTNNQNNSSNSPTNNPTNDNNSNNNENNNDTETDNNVLDDNSTNQEDDEKNNPSDNTNNSQENSNKTEKETNNLESIIGIILSLIILVLVIIVVVIFKNKKMKK